MSMEPTGTHCGLLRGLRGADGGVGGLSAWLGQLQRTVLRGLVLLGVCWRFCGRFGWAFCGVQDGATVVVEPVCRARPKATTARVQVMARTLFAGFHLAR
jgi:hypothetical protein